VRLARGVWRPAKHIFARRLSRRATLCSSICQRPIVENRGGMRGETPGTATGTVALLNQPGPAPSQTGSNRYSWSNSRKNQCKYFTMNNLQLNSGQTQSKSVKVRQTCFAPPDPCHQGFPLPPNTSKYRFCSNEDMVSSVQLW